MNCLSWLIPVFIFWILLIACSSAPCISCGLVVRSREGWSDLCVCVCVCTFQNHFLSGIVSFQQEACSVSVIYFLGRIPISRLMLKSKCIHCSTRYCGWLFLKQKGFSEEMIFKDWYLNSKSSAVCKGLGLGILCSWHSWCSEVQHDVSWAVRVGSDTRWIREVAGARFC